MNYVLQDLYIYKGQNSRGNYYWAQGSLFYEEDPYDNPSQLPIYPILNSVIVDQLKKVAKVDPTADASRPRMVVDIAALQQAIDTKKFPDGTECRFDLLHVKNVFPHTIKLNGIWARVATRATEISMLDGTKKTIPTGAFIPGKNGSITPTTELRVYIKHNADGNPVEEPSAVVNRILERRYKPLTDISTATLPSAAPAETTMPAEATAEVAAQQAAEANALGAAF